MAGSDQGNISKYKSAFKGSVPRDFTRPAPFKIVTVRPGAGIGEYGYGAKISHPTPTDPHGKK